MSSVVTQLHVRAVAGIPRLSAGDDLAALLCEGPARTDLADGDVVCVSSKAVAKTEARTVNTDRQAVIDAETDRVVARRGALVIVRTRHGLVLAAAGVDVSNTVPGTVVALPTDPDASARRLRETLAARTGRNVGVVVTDTVGRAWREGQTDIAVGCAGLPPLVDLAGRHDAYAGRLTVTAPAIADEAAGASDLVLDKAGLTPVAVVSGLAALVLPSGEHGPGAAALVRPEREDIFGFGAADAVHAAVRRGGDDRRGFADHLVEWAGLVAEAAAPLHERLRVEQRADGAVVARGDPLAAGALGERLRVLGWPHGIAVHEAGRADGTVWTWVPALDP